MVQYAYDSEVFIHYWRPKGGQGTMAPILKYAPEHFLPSTVITMVSYYDQFSHYTADRRFVFGNGKQLKPFPIVSVRLRQGCVLSFLLFFIYMNWINKCSQANECAGIGNCRISRLVFADDLVLLFSTKPGLQRALNSFADACDSARMKISTAKLRYFIFQKPLISACCK